MPIVANPQERAVAALDLGKLNALTPDANRFVVGPKEAH